MQGMSRICLFSFYDEQGTVDDYVIYFLKELGKHVETILFYSNGPLSKDSQLALLDLVAEVVIRPTEGSDVMAYKEALEKIDFDREGLYEEVLMVNHTCYGPIFPFAELFHEMEKRECDFWSVTAHTAVNSGVCVGSTGANYNLDTNFVAVRRTMLRSDAFRYYWNNLDRCTVNDGGSMGHTETFTQYFRRLGYKSDSYIDSEKYGSHYPAVLDIDETLLDRNPLIKRRAFFHDPRFLEYYAADLPRALRIIEEHSDYDTSLIWRNIVRSSELRNLNTNAGLTSVLPDIRLKRDGSTPDYGAIAVCAHVYYTEMLEELLTLTDTIPCEYDFIATTESEAKKAIIENMVRGRKNIGNVIVRVVEQNRGRDMSSLFITCRDLFLDDRYDLVCRLHTKKSPQVAAGRGNFFKRHMFENLLSSPGFTSNVLDMFHEKPWIGVAIPPLIHMFFPTMGHAWFGNKERARELADQLDVKVAFDPDTPIGAFGTMFWFRPKALRKLFAHRWQWSDFNAEPHHVDGGLAHVLERLICYVAQDARYTTQQILSTHLAGPGYAMLEYKLQKLSATLPNSGFPSQVEMVEKWKQAGYPLTRIMRSNEYVYPETLRAAAKQVLLSSKHSLAHRAPWIAAALKPIYRAVTLNRSRTRNTH